MKEAEQGKVALMGFSAGAAVAIYVAAQNQGVSSIIACACPDTSRLAKDRKLAQTVIADYRKMGVIKDTDLPPSLQSWMKGFAEIYSDKWIDKLAPRPILIIHGDQDDMVFPTSAFNLYERAGGTQGNHDRQRDRTQAAHIRTSHGSCARMAQSHTFRD